MYSFGPFQERREMQSQALYLETGSPEVKTQEQNKHSKIIFDGLIVTTVVACSFHNKYGMYTESYT